MKAISTLTLLAVIAAFTFPNTAQAGDKEEALIGGLIGGLIIGAAIADDDTHVSVGYRSGGHYGQRDSHGYWDWVSVKTWVPGYYERSCDRHGHVRKVWISGHYTFHKRKVWVDTHRHGSHRPSYRESRRYDNHRDHGHHDRKGRIVRRF
ncbi:hypothetical protein [Pelagicoccus sp. SDUM812002]|uniref:hypothetical protein n=1 Tax=Pelagicoccus sp. SDUM812002 TaxID=3041266 RepID=UPI00280DF218|nr:hypothetical protein [Pelagicoccus sp. SDUM812002]MDQ8185647.1 hypothetical protein [Pelagicoccus sp. SDUM812002]